MLKVNKEKTGWYAIAGTLLIVLGTWLSQPLLIIPALLLSVLNIFTERSFYKIAIINIVICIVSPFALLVKLIMDWTSYILGLF